MHEREKWKGSRSVMSDSSWLHGLQPTRLLHPWDFPGKSTGVGCHRLLQFFLEQIMVISRRHKDPDHKWSGLLCLKNPLSKHCTAIVHYDSWTKICLPHNLSFNIYTGSCSKQDSRANTVDTMEKVAALSHGVKHFSWREWMRSISISKLHATLQSNTELCR